VGYPVRSISTTVVPQKYCYYYYYFYLYRAFASIKECEIHQEKKNNQKEPATASIEMFEKFCYEIAVPMKYILFSISFFLVQAKPH
jgi:hypothetical protein